MASLEIHTHSVEETVAFGRRLGAVLQAGDFVALEGPLGAGKTRFVEGLARGLGVDEATPIPSPTYTLVNEHAGRFDLLHADLYRLEGRDELEGIGWSDYLARDAILVVEWLSVVGLEVAPADRIEARIEILDEHRRAIRLGATGPRSSARLDAVGAAAL
jgi:tRNA threonylcarbamoyladenosine biosynthesis protein TsaE